MRKAVGKVENFGGTTTVWSGEVAMSRKRAHARQSSPAADYKLTEREAHIAGEMIDRGKTARSVKLAITQSSANGANVSVQHPDLAVGTVLMMNALGTVNDQFVDAIVMQLCHLASADGKVDGPKLNRALSMVTGVKPNDEVEAMLATQMAAVHNATINAALHLNSANMLNQVEAYTNGLNKLARTFAAQVEALKKYRASGEQTISVQHVNVTAEQAVVGNVHTGGGGTNEKRQGQYLEPRAAEPKALAYEPGTAMLSNVETLRSTLQGAGRERTTCVPIPRRAGRST